MKAIVAFVVSLVLCLYLWFIADNHTAGSVVYLAVVYTLMHLPPRLPPTA